MYLKTKNGTVEVYPYYISQLRAENPQTGFPEPVPADILEQFNIYEVQLTNKPDYNKLTQKVEEITPVNIDGIWQQTWEVIDLTQEEKDHALLVARNAASLSPAEFRIGVLRMGEFDRIEEYINQEETSQEIKIMYKYATAFERMNTVLLQIAKDMGFSDQQLDDLFNIR